MATGIKLADAQLRALRLLVANGGWVPEANHTDENKPCVLWHVVQGLMPWQLVDQRAGDWPSQLTYRITSKGRHVLAEHEAGGS